MEKLKTPGQAYEIKIKAKKEDRSSVSKIIVEYDQGPPLPIMKVT